MREWLRNHQLFSYFALVFLISWIPGIPHWMGIEGQAIEMAFWIAGSGPSLAALIITWLISPKLSDETAQEETLCLLDCMGYNLGGCILSLYSFRKPNFCWAESTFGHYRVLTFRSDPSSYLVGCRIKESFYSEGFFVTHSSKGTTLVTIFSRFYCHCLSF